MPKYCSRQISEICLNFNPLSVFIIEIKLNYSEKCLLGNHPRKGKNEFTLKDNSKEQNYFNKNIDFHIPQGQKKAACLKNKRPQNFDYLRLMNCKNWINSLVNQSTTDITD